MAFTKGWEVPATDLQDMIKQTSFAVSTEESRPILNGVLWQRTGTGMRLVATDGHRLAITTKAIDALTSGFDDLIVPPKALEQVRRLFPADGPIEVARAENHLGLRSATTEVYTRLIEGPYPGWGQVIPKKLTRAATIDRTAFIHAIKRISPLASSQTHRIVLAFGQGDNTVTLTAQAVDVGDALDQLAVRWTGEPFKVGFNAEYLLEVLAVLVSDDITMKFTDSAERPAVLVPEPDEETQFYLVMPMRVE